jgi:hypothetical protein
MMPASTTLKTMNQERQRLAREREGDTTGFIQVDDEEIEDLGARKQAPE